MIHALCAMRLLLSGMIGLFGGSLCFGGAAIRGDCLLRCTSAVNLVRHRAASTVVGVGSVGGVAASAPGAVTTGVWIGAAGVAAWFAVAPCPSSVSIAAWSPVSVAVVLAATHSEPESMGSVEWPASSWAMVGLLA